MAVAKGVGLNHVARETSDVNRLASFYEQILGFERIDAPKFGDFQVVWLKLPPFSLHIIERNPESKLLEGPFGKSQPLDELDPKEIARGHHLSFSVSNFNEFVRVLKEEKGIRVCERTQPDGKTKQAFFFDPDGNGLEVGSFNTPQS